jgi:tetratricopeptide (TPR) repeat protein
LCKATQPFFIIIPHKLRTALQELIQSFRFGFVLTNDIGVLDESFEMWRQRGLFVPHETPDCMKRQTHILLALVVLALSLTARAQKASTPQPALVDRTLSDASFTKGIEAMHDLDFEEARRRFEEVKQRFPDHPAGQYYLAANLFLRTLTEPSRLLPLLSNLSGSKTFGEKSEDKVDQETMQQFRALTRQARLLARARLERDSHDPVALYFLGATYGLSAAFKGTLEGSVIGAMRDGSSGVDKHRELLKLDASFHDAELSLGLYDYTVGALPLPVKVMAAIANVRGSKKRGLETLERVGREGKLERYISKLILVILYKREKRYAEALERARELTASYPRNYLFKLAEADSLVSQAAAYRLTKQPTSASLEREAFAIFDSMLNKPDARGAPAPPVELIHFIYGEALLKAGQAERATGQFLAAASAPRADISIVTIAHLRGAQAFDLAGRRREASAQYEIVMKRPNAYHSRERAAQGLQKPYQE